MRLLVCIIPFTVEQIPSTTRSERLLGLICLLMFFIGMGLACHVVVNWWNARMERLILPPLRRLIKYELDSDKRWQPTKVLWFRLSRTRASHRAPPSYARKIRKG